jgi:hypothetical protein
LQSLLRLARPLFASLFIAKAEAGFTAPHLEQRFPDKGEPPSVCVGGPTDAGAS